MLIQPIPVKDNVYNQGSADTYRNSGAISKIFPDHWASHSPRHGGYLIFHSVVIVSDLIVVQAVVPSEIWFQITDTHGDFLFSFCSPVELKLHSFHVCNSTKFFVQSARALVVLLRLCFLPQLVVKMLQKLRTLKGVSLSHVLAAWVRIMKPSRADWLAVLKELKKLNNPAHLELAGHFELANKTFEEIKLLGLPLDKRSCGSTVMVYIRAGMPEQGEILLREMDELEIFAGSEVCKALLRAYSMIGNTEGAQRVFNAIQFAG
ncbi:hypothetical protein NL676_019402 [Syzygium grande]|nr:hypothetical protein NL676_019402 [Syzygium grande]